MAIKQRYTVTVAGYEMNVRSDNTPAEVEEIVGALDRGIRDVCARNRNLPRNEAIILCALDAYSEKRKAAHALREVEARLAHIERETTSCAPTSNATRPPQAEPRDRTAREMTANE